MADDTHSASGTQSPVIAPTLTPNVNLSAENQLISINATAQAPIKLTDINYISWHTQWYSLLVGYDLLKFVEKPLSQDFLSVPYWKRQDQLIRSALLASLSTELVSYVVAAKTSYEVWATLANTYATPSQARLMSLRESLFTIKKGTMNITTFLQKVKSTTSVLSMAGVTISMSEILLYVLHGLPPEFKEVAAALRARDTPITFEELHDKLADFEAQLERETFHVNVPASVNYANKSAGTRPNMFNSGSNAAHRNVHSSSSWNNNNSSSNQKSGATVICQFCDKPGHVRKKCFKLNKLCPLLFTSPNVVKPQVTFASANSASKPTWVLDSGANQHVTQDIHNLSLHSEYDGSADVMLGDGNSYPISHIGSVSFPSFKRPLQLTNVLCVPGLNKSLISVYQFCLQNNVEVSFTSSLFTVKDLQTGALLAEGKPTDGMYEWPPPLPKPTPSHVSVSHTTATTHPIWHRRLGHPSTPIMRLVFQSLNLSSSSISDTKFFCDSCKCNKMHKTPFCASSMSSSAPLELIYSNVWGPAPVSSIDGFQYYLIFVDHYTKYIWLFPLKRKSDVSIIFPSYMKLVENLFHRKIGSFYSDNGGEFIALRSFFKDNGISHFLTPPYTPEHNAVAERRHRHIVETGLTMLHLAHLPLKFWSFAFQTAAYLINRMPTPILENVSPFYKLYDKFPNYDKLRVFGCLCYPWLRPYNSNKLQSKSTPCVFVGYSLNQSAYQCYDPITSNVFLSRHVDFVEHSFPFSHLHSNLERPHSNSVDTWTPIHFVLPLTSSGQVGYSIPSAVSSPMVRDSPLPPSSSKSSNFASGSDINASYETVTATQLQPHESAIVPVTDHAPVVSTHPMATRSKNNIYKPINRMCLSTEVALNPWVPKTVAQALKDPKWRTAMDEEYSALLTQRTWTLVPSAEASNVVSCKWLFRVKTDSAGTPIRYKARLVARGFTQRPGLDFDQTFSPVAKHATIRVILTIAVTRGWILRQVDVNNAFLHGKLSEIVFMEQPPGYVDDKLPNHVCRLEKSLYGLKQAPRVWYYELKTFLTSVGFVQTHFDHCLFVCHTGNIILYLIVYVDDIIVTGNVSSEVEKFVTRLGQHFSIKDLGDLNYFLGVEVTRTSKGMFLSQHNYVRELLEKSQMAGANSVATPISQSVSLCLADSPPLTDASEYRRIIGGLQYLLLTRPDLAFVVNKLSQFASTPTTTHWAAHKRVLRLGREP